MIALIDADVVVYRVGFASEDQTEAQNCFNCELVMEDIMNAVEATESRVFLSDKLENNFRFKVDNKYKANRKDAPKPKFYDSLKLFLKDKYKAETTTGQEADDALGIAQDKEGNNTVIATIDKDLLQIPGYHYNLATGEKRTVNYVEGIRYFYKQLLIGDRVDNIEGIRGIGPKKAGAILDGCDLEYDMFERVRTLYDEDERLLRNGKLLYIRRREGEDWEFPKEPWTDEDLDNTGR